MILRCSDLAERTDSGVDEMPVLLWHPGFQVFLTLSCRCLGVAPGKELGKLLNVNIDRNACNTEALVRHN